MLRYCPAAEPYLDAFLDLEFEIAWPYRRFVLRDRDVAVALQRQLFARGACEFAPPAGWVGLDGDEIAGMYAALAGAELRRRRLKEGLVMARTVTLPDPQVADRSRLASRVMRPVEDDDWYLSRIAVVAGHRGRGVARSILAHVLSEGATLGMRRCVLDVEPTNAAAIRVYESAGFELSGVESVDDPQGGQGLSYARYAITLSRAP